MYRIAYFGWCRELQHTCLIIVCCTGRLNLQPVVHELFDARRLHGIFQIITDMETSPLTIRPPVSLLLVVRLDHRRHFIFSSCVDKTVFNSISIKMKVATELKTEKYLTLRLLTRSEHSDAHFSCSSNLSSRGTYVATS